MLHFVLRFVLHFSWDPACPVAAYLNVQLNPFAALFSPTPALHAIEFKALYRRKSPRKSSPSPMPVPIPSGLEERAGERRPFTTNPNQWQCPGPLPEPERFSSMPWSAGGRFRSFSPLRSKSPNGSSNPKRPTVLPLPGERAGVRGKGATNCIVPTRGEGRGGGGRNAFVEAMNQRSRRALELTEA
jgi:hypothetical protein